MKKKEWEDAINQENERLEERRIYLEEQWNIWTEEQNQLREEKEKAKAEYDAEHEQEEEEEEFSDEEQENIKKQQ